jgi:deazaflavin-dependent oxidoreductase (nitroreductase family)
MTHLRKNAQIESAYACVVSAKRKAVVGFQKYVLNPVSRRIPRIAGVCLLETVGRRTGRARITPVGAKRENGTFWIVAEQGRHANYVRNILANPRVRIRHKGRWHEGTARIAPDEDPRRHTHGVNGLIVRLMGTELLTIRIDPTS